MKQAVVFGIIWLFCSSTFAIAPVVLSGPSPAISSRYTANTSNIVIYKVNNNVPKSLPLSVSGISNPIKRITVAGDCGNTLPAGPSTCNIGLNINPSNGQINSTINQTLKIDYQGRTPLTSSISFSVAAASVVLSGPSPAISPTYTANTSNIVIYTVTNYNVFQNLPLSVSGISNPIQRITVANDCGNTLPAAPSTCNIGLNINPSSAQIGSTINQTLIVDYQGGTPLTSPISFSVVGIFAYVTPTLFSEAIDQFLLDDQGLLSSSFTQATEATPPQSFGQMTFATVNGVQYAYILDPLGAVYWCSIHEDGSFYNCMSTSSTPGLGNWSPRGISFATFDNQYAYVVDASTGFVYQFFLDSTGNFSQYILYNNLGLNAPNNIAFATDANGEQQSYIADAGGNVFLCPMQTNGIFSSTCSPTPSSGAPSSWVPFSVAFNPANGIQYAYVADNGASVGAGNVYRCTLNADGSFENSSCIKTPTNAAPHWNPYYIAIKTVNAETYAYVVDQVAFNPGNIYRCLIDQNGLLTDCELTPTNPPANWQPTGIAFR